MSDEPVESTAVELEPAAPEEGAARSGSPAPAAPARELVRHEAPPPAQVNLFGAASPAQVIEQAASVAKALKDVLVRQRMIQNIQGRDHVKVEGWQTVGAMIGLSARVVHSKPMLDPVSGDATRVSYEVVEFNRRTNVERRFTVEGLEGWEARVDIVRAGDGQIIATGEGMCSRNESTWAKRDDYSLRSMAMTRATSKAFRGVLGFVVTMAGYEATPSEEMPPPEPQSPFGTPASDKLSTTFNKALTYIVGEQDVDAVRAAIIEDAGGYLPTAAARGTIFLASRMRQQAEAEAEARQAEESAAQEPTGTEEPEHDSPEGAEGTDA